MSGQIWVVLTPIIVWLGVFVYALRVERRLAALESSVEEREP
jgi:CcmD family protein